MDGTLIAIHFKVDDFGIKLTPNQMVGSVTESVTDLLTDVVNDMTDF